MNNLARVEEHPMVAEPSPASDPFVRIEGLTVTFTGGRKPVRAVGGVDLDVQRGEVIALARAVVTSGGSTPASITGVTSALNSRCHSGPCGRSQNRTDRYRSQVVAWATSCSNVVRNA